MLPAVQEFATDTANNWQILVSIAVGITILWNFFISKRFNDMRDEFDMKLKDKQELNKVRMDSIEQQLSKVDAKIDMLIQLAISNKQATDSRGTNLTGGL